ncbi:MAG: hypothetical protein M3Q06_14710, partial [Bacteroidota bacterium]|nr:hypothetical protein [Bacteroidota bacterium]
GSILNAADAVRSNLQFRLEAGYQYNSKPIQLGKKRTASPPATQASETAMVTVIRKSSCGAYTNKSHCGSKTRTIKATPENRSMNMRLQPALALAYIPSSTQSLKQTAGGFDYTAGTWKTALVPSMGFAFAKGAQPLFTLTAFYTKPLGQKEETAFTQIESKTIQTPLQPTTSTWGLTLGLPISFAKTKATKVQSYTEKKEFKKTTYKQCRRWQ